ncbi:MAG: twitching motility protein PilI, partial [Steroidobacteraceae bacterium]|nr:twitching motility protein PilI [Steroidobacteraceae bacterium]
MGGETFLVERDEAREVMGVPAPITRVPGARPWIMGLANVRGQLLPVIDLKQYFGSGELVTGRNTRVVRGTRVHGGGAADDNPVRALSGRVVPARQRGLAGIEPPNAGREPGVPARFDLKRGLERVWSMVNLPERHFIAKWMPVMLGAGLAAALAAA